MPRSHNATGRSRTKGPFALIPEAVVRSAAYTATSCAGRALLVELAVLYRSNNNGSLGLSARQAADRLRCSKDTAARAFRELLEHGLIERTQRGDFKAKALSLASEYRLTWRRCDRSNHLPSQAYLRWKPTANERAQKSGTISGTARSDIEDSGQP